MIGVIFVTHRIVTTEQTILKYEYMNCSCISFLALSLGLYC